MTLLNSTAATSGGESLGTFTTPDGKEVQGFVQVDDSGHIVQTLPSYTWWVPPAAVGASKLYGDIFNATGSGKVMEVRGIWAIPKSDTAVTGALAVEIGLYRTSAVGTGGTAHTYNGGSTSASHVITPWDTTNPALPAGVTARAVPTAGATIAALWWPQWVFTEETSPATYQAAFTNLIPTGVITQRLTLREGQGLLIKQGTVASVGTIGFLVLFTLV